MKPEVEAKTETLIGKYFRSANETNKVEWQGAVIAEPHSAGISCNCSSGVQARQRSKD